VQNLSHRAGARVGKLIRRIGNNRFKAAVANYFRVRDAR